jgi:uncharacterized membrane protein YhaH (DUF805 family)
MQWIVTPFMKYADFGGRATRREFWSFLGLFAAVTIAARYIDGMDGERVPVAAGMGVLELSASLILLLPTLSCGARRLHDTGRAGWWMMLLYLPYLGWIAAAGNRSLMLIAAGAIIVGAVALVILLLLPGTPMENRFGADPRGVGTLS